MLDKIFVLFGVIVAIAFASPFAIDLKSARSLRVFHHQVHIHSEIGEYVHTNCSGSIVENQWILTSKKCVNQLNTKITVDFKDVDAGKNIAYSIVLKNPEVYVYPIIEDIALLQLPFNLIYMDNIKSVPYWQNDVLGNVNLGIMPRYTNDSDAINVYEITQGKECTEAFGDSFDPKFQLCTKNYNYINNKILSKEDYGAGLLINWPNNPQLVGILTNFANCDLDNTCVGVFTFVGKFTSFISDIIAVNNRDTTTSIAI